MRYRVEFTKGLLGYGVHVSVPERRLALVAAHVAWEEAGRPDVAWEIVRRYVKDEIVAVEPVAGTEGE